MRLLISKPTSIYVPARLQHLNPLNNATKCQTNVHIQESGEGYSHSNHYRVLPFHFDSHRGVNPPLGHYSFWGLNSASFVVTKYFRLLLSWIFSPSTMTGFCCVIVAWLAAVAFHVFFRNQLLVWWAWLYMWLSASLLKLSVLYI